MLRAMASARMWCSRAWRLAEDLGEQFAQVVECRSLAVGGAEVAVQVQGLVEAGRGGRIVAGLRVQGAEAVVHLGLAIGRAEIAEQV